MKRKGKGKRDVKNNEEFLEKNVWTGKDGINVEERVMRCYFSVFF
jgi:hypothetical protein